MNTSRFKYSFEGSFLNFSGAKLVLAFLVRSSVIGGGASAENFATYPLQVLRNEEVRGISACLCCAVASVAGCLCSIKDYRDI